MNEHFLVILQADEAIGRGYTLDEALGRARAASSRVSRYAEVFSFTAPARLDLSEFRVGPRGSVNYPNECRMDADVYDLRTLERENAHT